MLKGISPLISPSLLKVLNEMGHGDQILFADGNFPSHSYGVPVVRLDGVGIPALLEAVLPLFPLDSFVEFPVITMHPNADFGRDPVVWSHYRSLITRYEPQAKIQALERFAFYELCKKVYAIVATTELEIYANLLLQKGVIFPKVQD